MRAAIYIRVSSAEQRREGYSLPEQRRVLEEYAKEKNYIVVDVYADEGISASKKPHLRHDFQRMLRDVEKGRIDIILFIKLDRWFRNVGDYYRTQSILDKHGVVWKSVLEDFDTTTRTGRLNLNIKLTIAEDEAASASERVKFVFDGKIKNKEPITGMQPFGYMIEERDGVKRIIKDPSQQAETEEMFALFFETLSAYKVAQHINEKYGKKHADNTIARRLRNPAYAGEYRGIPDYYPPYITQQQRAVILRTFARATRKAQGQKVYLFSGMIVCPLCGHTLASCTMNKSVIAYRCRYHGVLSCDYRHAIKEEMVERFLIDNLSDHIVAHKQRQEKKKKEKKREDPKKYEDRLKRLTTAFVMGNLDEEEYRTESVKLKAKIADLKAQNTQNDTGHQEPLKALSNKMFLTEYWTLSREQKRLLWQKCIDRIEVDGITPTAVYFLE